MHSDIEFGEKFGGEDLNEIERPVEQVRNQTCPTCGRAMGTPIGQIRWHGNTWYHYFCLPENRSLANLLADKWKDLTNHGVP